MVDEDKMPQRYNAELIWEDDRFGVCYTTSDQGSWVRANSVEPLVAEIECLSAENAKLKSTDLAVAMAEMSLRDEIERLRARVAELEQNLADANATAAHDCEGPTVTQPQGNLVFGTANGTFANGVVLSTLDGFYVEARARHWADSGSNKPVYFKDLDNARLFAKDQLNHQFPRVRVIDARTRRVVDDFNFDAVPDATA